MKGLIIFIIFVLFIRVLGDISPLLLYIFAIVVGLFFLAVGTDKGRPV